MTRAALVALLFLLSAPALAREPLPPAAVAAAQAAALQALVDGNARFVEGKQAPRNLGAERHAELAKGQNPRAVVLACSDSRVPPEHVFDQQLGEVFAVRTAGNVADAVALGSIEYAVMHMGTPLIVVLGHSSCGAVQAAVEIRKTHAHADGNVGEVMRLIQPAVAQAEKTKPSDLVSAAVDANVELEAKAILKRSPAIAELVKAGRVKIVTARYDLVTGKVQFGAPASP